MSEAYYNWFSKNWYKAKGLIQPSKAGSMVGLSGARITQIWREKNLPLYIYKNEKPFIGWNDFLNFKAERDCKKNN
jgi:hypothetical protein